MGDKRTDLKHVLVSRSHALGTPYYLIGSKTIGLIDEVTDWAWYDMALVDWWITRSEVSVKGVYERTLERIEVCKCPPYIELQINLRVPRG